MCITEKKPPSSWPLNGQIQFDCMSLRYSKEDDPVLKTITCSIKANEKVFHSITLMLSVFVFL